MRRYGHGHFSLLNDAAWERHLDHVETHFGPEPPPIVRQLAASKLLDEIDDDKCEREARNDPDVFGYERATRPREVW